MFDERPDVPALTRACPEDAARILVAEDNPVNRIVAEELLRTAGLAVESVGDGMQAVEMACTRRYALVLMDVHMPGLDGLDAARAIRAAVGPSLPIVALTGADTSADRAACRAAGMDDHLVKPVDPDALFALLRRWLSPQALSRVHRRA